MTNKRADRIDIRIYSQAKEAFLAGNTIKTGKVTLFWLCRKVFLVN